MAHARLAGYLRDLADRMGLRDWEVILEDVPADPDNRAESFCTHGRRRVAVRLAYDFGADTPEARRQTVIHELMHAHFAAMHRVCKLALGAEVYDAYLLLFEYGIDAAADALAPHLPLPPTDDD